MGYELDQVLTTYVSWQQRLRILLDQIYTFDEEKLIWSLLISQADRQSKLVAVRWGLPDISTSYDFGKVLLKKGLKIVTWLNEEWRLIEWRNNLLIKYLLMRYLFHSS